MFDFSNHELFSVSDIGDIDDLPVALWIVSFQKEIDESRGISHFSVENSHVNAKRKNLTFLVVRTIKVRTRTLRMCDRNVRIF